MTSTPFASATPQPETGEVVITYIYDPLYRLTDADYSTGEFYHYTYDEVGNRLTEETHLESHAYVYDVANRLSSVDTASYTFDDNGNLLDDGTSTYTYDAANRLASVNGTTTYAYNGLGDRYEQTVSSTTTTYILDLNAGLTQVLDDGDNAYLYGLGRVAEVGSSTEYFMGDALGSVRQLLESGDIVLAKSYAPYGEDLYSTSSGDSAFAFTGEQTDPNGLVYLRARYYGPYLNQFIQPDTIVPDPRIPADWNKYAYVRNNPINYTDHSGQTVDTQPVDCLWGYIIGTDGVIICNIVTLSHHYVISTVVCPFYLFCTRTDMVDYMSRFAFPGQRVNEPVLVDRDDAVAPFGWFKDHPEIYGNGAIRVRVYPGGLTTENITYKTHIFHEGNVVRTGSQDWKGAWWVNTDGSGQNSSWEIALVNQFAGRQIFVEVDEMMKVYIISKKVPAHLRSLGNLLINFQCEIREYQSSQ